MRTFVEIGSMRETQLTGIGETVCRLAECALKEGSDSYRFIVGAAEVHRDVVAEVVETRSGAALGAYLLGSFANALQVDPDDWNAGLFLHRVSLGRMFDAQAVVLYDLTPFICPQYHSVGTVDDFTTSFNREMAAVDNIVTISDAVYQDLVGYFPEYRDRAVASLCGLPADTLKEPGRSLPLSLRAKPYFMSLGTLEPRKNNILIFEMLSKHRELLKSHRFVFVGKRGWGEDFEELIRVFTLQEAVAAGDILFTGFVTDEVKRELIAGCTALIYPSHYEGFGLPLIEALAMGRPVICQPNSSIPQATGDHAFYIERSDPGALLCAIERVLAQPDVIAAASATYRDWAAKFRWSGMWQTLKVCVQPSAAIS